MRQNSDRATERKPLSPFALYLRTGFVPRAIRGDIELKFNPWHDPENGRFTFAGGGQYFGSGQGNFSAKTNRSQSNRTAPVNRGTSSSSPGGKRFIYDEADPRNPRNHSLHVVRRGETLTSIAVQRKGVTVADLAWLNGIRADAPLRVGQSIKLPNQDFLDTGRDAFGVARGLVAYMDRHRGQIPSGPGPIVDQLIADRTQVARNGYTFQQDGLLRTRVSQGTLSNEVSKPSPLNQRAAGGEDRRSSDDGGHYIARRFNGPSDRVNLFAQDRNFNRGAYRILEDKLAAYQRQGKSVYVRIIPYYRGLSQRPYKIDYWWQIDGQWARTRFDNEEGGHERD